MPMMPLRTPSPTTSSLPPPTRRRPVASACTRTTTTTTAAHTRSATRVFTPPISACVVTTSAPPARTQTATGMATSVLRRGTTTPGGTLRPGSTSPSLPTRDPVSPVPVSQRPTVNMSALVTARWLRCTPTGALTTSPTRRTSTKRAFATLPPAEPRLRRPIRRLGSSASGTTTRPIARPMAWSGRRSATTTFSTASTTRSVGRLPSQGSTTSVTPWTTPTSTPATI
mmetsp:Transcript_12122/g.24097  ORF Transcript_12122/g.24097 Transcript_12122/m.24097 type:complete len:227 (-) Transcript_12122:1781-2461(-)